jgi:CobQ-like glutamine amidotransferase family enzyme
MPQVLYRSSLAAGDGRRLRLAHLYPDQMNLYGDRGNVLALIRRAEWRGIAVTVEGIQPGEQWEPWAYDLLFMGGGEDSHQVRVAPDFLRMGEALARALAQGVPMLAICGAYQLLGRYYETADHRRLSGIGWLDAWTEAGGQRAIGDAVVESLLDIEPKTLVGFENHGGRTFLGGGLKPLGRVRLGKGNNGRDGFEGAVREHTIGTYLHGSLLPKNPHLTDLLLRWALASHGQDERLEPVPSEVEFAAHAVICERVRR